MIDMTTITQLEGKIINIDLRIANWALQCKILVLSYFNSFKILDRLSTFHAFKFLLLGLHLIIFNSVFLPIPFRLFVPFWLIFII